MPNGQHLGNRTKFGVTYSFYEICRGADTRGVLIKRHTSQLFEYTASINLGKYHSSPSETNKFYYNLIGAIMDAMTAKDVFAESVTSGDYTFN